MAMIPAFRVESEAYEQCIQAASGTRSLRNVELPGELLEQFPRIKANVATYGLRTIHVHDVMSPQITRYLAEKPRRFQQKVAVQSVEQLNALRSVGIDSADLDIGLQRIDERYQERDITTRVEILRDLINGSDESITLAIPIRYPPLYPASQEWTRGVNIVYELDHPCCRIGVDVFPGEVDEEDIAPAVGRMAYSAAFIRFHYQPRMGEDIDGWRAKTWMDQLRRQRYQGKLMFCPGVKDDHQREEACRGIDMLLDTG